MSTFHSIHFHIVFSTKHRKPWIDDKWIGDLHGYLGGTVNGLGAAPLKIGGVADHVHMLVGCKTTHRPARRSPDQGGPAICRHGMQQTASRRVKSNR